MPDLLRRLQGVVGAKGARQGENENVTDNAVSSLAKIARYRPNAPGVQVRRVFRRCVWPASLLFAGAPAAPRPPRASR